MAWVTCGMGEQNPKWQPLGSETTLPFIDKAATWHLQSSFVHARMLKLNVRVAEDVQKRVAAYMFISIYVYQHICSSIPASQRD